MRSFALFCLPFLLVTGMFVRSAAAKDEIVYIDLQRAISETEEGKRAQARLKKAFADKRKSLSKLEKKLMADKKAIAKLPIGEQRSRRQADFAEALVKLRTATKKSQTEIDKLQKKELEPIQRKMSVIIERIGRSRDYMMILEASAHGMVFAKPHLNITDEAIRQYNARHR